MSKTKRRSAWIFVALFVLGTGAPAFAADDDPIAKVEALKKAIANPDAKWADKWKAYREAKDAIEAAKGEKKETAQSAYEAIREDVAKAIQRDDLPLSGWLMGFFGATLLWGGLAFCIGVARKKGGSGGRGAA